MLFNLNLHRIYLKNKYLLKSVKIISISKLSDLYEKISKNNRIKPVFIKGIFNYLNLSVHYSRDERDFDLINYELLKSLVYSNRLNLGKIKKCKFSEYYKNYFFNFKEFDYLLSIGFPALIFKDILKIFKQIIDILVIFSIIFIYSLKNSFKNYLFPRNKLFEKKIYSIYYWKNKRNNSASYYYPTINKGSKNIAFISSFADSKYFLFIGLIQSLKDKNYLSPANTLELKGLLLSSMQFIHLFFYDLLLVIFKKDCKLIKFWYDWKKCSEIFYSLLIYNSIFELVKHSNRCEFISWHENQVTNRSFSLGVSNALKRFDCFSELSTYNGSPISLQSKRQYFPTKNEYLIGFWGKRYYVQDEESKKEMEVYFSKEDIKIEIQKVPSSMIRIKKYDFKQFQNLKKIRAITIFSHDSYWDLIACLLSVIDLINNKYIKSDLIMGKYILVNVRLHPFLEEELALKKILCFNDIPKNLKLEFISNSQESIIESIKKSTYCFFGLSSYINLAISLNANVIAVNTNHINKSPINTKFTKTGNFLVSNPW